MSEPVKMKKQSSFSANYQDPRWQKKRLEIMERDDFECQDCGDKTTMLNVHHIYYNKGAMPWEYPNSALITLCQNCHNDEHQYAFDLEKLLAYSLKRTGIRPGQIASMGFTVESLVSAYGPDKTKKIIETIDLFSFRLVDDKDLFSKFEAFLEETKKPASAGAVDAQ